MTKPTPPLPDEVAELREKLWYTGPLRIKRKLAERILAHIQAQAERIAELSDAWQKAADEADAIADSYDMLKGAWATDLAKLKNAEAELALVREWARGRCECCASWQWKIFNIDGFDTKSEFCTQKVDRQPCNWTPAWEVKG